jgi:hypothetical protein
MQLFYDHRDEKLWERRGLRTLYWLDDLGARPLSEADPGSEGFLFAAARPIEDYRRLVEPFPGILDRPEARAPLLQLDTILQALDLAAVEVPRPRSWCLDLDQEPPPDLPFPLFVRTATTSWKRGGRVSRVRTRKELLEEGSELRRAFGWDERIIAREWLDLAAAGQTARGPIPQEIRVWIIDGVPFAWSFHYLHAVPSPTGFPPSDSNLRTLCDYAGRVGRAFSSRLVAADFARLTSGGWVFIEAGPGSCSGTGHEGVYKAVASRLMGVSFALEGNETGGLFED